MLRGSEAFTLSSFRTWKGKKSDQEKEIAIADDKTDSASSTNSNLSEVKFQLEGWQRKAAVSAKKLDTLQKQYDDLKSTHNIQIKQLEHANAKLEASQKLAEETAKEVLRLEDENRNLMKQNTGFMDQRDHIFEHYERLKKAYPAKLQKYKKQIEKLQNELDKLKKGDDVPDY